MKPASPPRVSDIYDEGQRPLKSARCAWWEDRVRNGWCRNRRLKTFGYEEASAYFGVYTWEYCEILFPLLRQMETDHVTPPPTAPATK